MSEAPHKKLIVWQKAFELTKEVYLLTEKFPKSEQFGIIQQIRRAAVSVVSNITEGAARSSSKEKIQFFLTARGSLAEMETQLLLSQELNFFTGNSIFEKIDEVSRLLNGLIQSRRKTLIRLLSCSPAFLLSCLFIFLLTCLPALHLTRYAYGAGESALVILEEPIGARPVGMGEAFTAVADDINALYYNPAGLSFLVRPELGTTYLKGLLDSYYGFAGFVYPFKKSALGLSLTTFDGGKMEINTLNPDGSFKESKNVSAEKDFIPMLSYSFTLGSALSFGLNLKIINSTLVDEYSANTYAGDVGLLIRPVNDKFCLGLLVKNFAPTGIKYKNLKNQLPGSIRAGFALKPADGLTISADYEKPIEQMGHEEDKKARGLWDYRPELKPRIHFGFEFLVMKLLALRGGYKFGYDQPTFNLGLGLGAKGFFLDYSFAGMKDLNSMHRMSFTTTFGALTNYRKGEGYYKKEMYERAIHWANKVKEDDENFAQAKEVVTNSRKQIASRHYYGKGQEYFNAGQYAQAIEQWQKVIEQLPKYRDTEERLTLAKSKLEESEATTTIVKAKGTIKEAESIGLDMEQAKKLLDESHDLFKKKEYVPAKAKADDSYQLASIALGKKKEEVKPTLTKPAFTGEKINIAVAELEAHNVSAMEAATVADYLRTELINSQVFVVLERSNMAKVLAEQRFQQTGCTATECAVQMGKILNVKAMIVGSFGKLMNNYSINVRLVDVETGAALAAEAVEFSVEGGVMEKIRELGAKIAAKVAGGQ